MAQTANPTTTDQLADFMRRNIAPLDKAFWGDDTLLRAIPVLSDEGGTGDATGGEYGLLEQRFKAYLPWTHGGRMSAGKPPKARKVAYGLADDWSTVEMDYDAAELGRKRGNLEPITNQLSDQFADAEQVLRIATAEGVLLDGTGRRMYIVSIENDTWENDDGDTINVSKVKGDPFLCHNRNAMDAVKYLHVSQSVDIISWDEATWTGAVVANGTDDEGYEIVYIHEDTTASSSYVYLYPRIPAEGPAAGHYLAANGFCGQDTTEASGLAVKGLFAQLGKGTVMGSYGGGTHVACLGDPTYGSFRDIEVDRLNDDRFNFFTGSCYNDSPYCAATNLTQIVLDDSVMLDAFAWHYKHSKASTGAESVIELLLVTTQVWKSYAFSAKDRASLFSTTPMNFDLGIGAQKFTFSAPYYNYKGRSIPLLIMDMLPEQTMLGLDTATLARIAMWSGWDRTAEHPDFPYFTRMTKFTRENILRAVYQRKSRFVNKHPSCLLSIHNIGPYVPA